MAKQQEIRGIVRIAGKDISGNRTLYLGLTEIKGISFMLANAILNVLGLDHKRKVGTLSDEEIKKIEEVLANPTKYGIPAWMLNRRKDLETGKDMHLVMSDLDFRKQEDIKRLINIKAYRGVRHMLGLKVRGQRTRSTGRRGRTVGVVRKKQQQQQKSKK